MGYRGKVVEQEQARQLRAAGWTYNEIAAEVGVAKSSVSLWCRDVPVDEATWASRARANRNEGARNRRPNRLQLAKQAEIERCRQEAAELVGDLSDRDLLIAGAALSSIPVSQFTRPYRAVADPSIRRSKHPHGCATVVYNSALAHRLVMGMVEAVLSEAPFRGSSAGRAFDC